MPSSLGSRTKASSSDTDGCPVRFVHTISEAGRLLHSASRWNSIEIDFNLGPQSANGYDSLPSRYSKSVDYDLIITDRKYFKRFLYISVSIALAILLLVLLIHFLPRKHANHGSSQNLTLAVNQALTFFDAQKSGQYPSNSPIKFRGDSGLHDQDSSQKHDLVGGFYDSGNNIKFSFPTAYTVTLLSWSVIEYHQKYDDIGELEHVKDIIRWGSDYLLKLFVAPNAASAAATLYSQVGSGSNGANIPNDINCWQRPEQMNYARPVSSCGTTVSDLAGEIVAALSAASLVFEEDTVYSKDLVAAAEKLFDLATKEDPKSQGAYTMVDSCGGDGRTFYNSSGYEDEPVWAGTWLFFATGNTSYLEYVRTGYKTAEVEETPLDKGIFYWNNKLTANAVLLTRLLYFHDLGYPFEDVLASSSNTTDSVMCSYLSDHKFNKTQGGLILLKPDYGTPLQFAATAAFVRKLYSDYLDLMRSTGRRCGSDVISQKMLRSFSMSQVSYILGDNPMKMSYMVGFGDHFLNKVHHRSASIPWDGQLYSCAEGERWRKSLDPNPNVLSGAMVAGPVQFDHFIDERDQPLFTEPTISSNSGLVAALIALHDPPRNPSDSNGINLGIDQTGIFRLAPTAP